MTTFLSTLLGDVAKTYIGIRTLEKQIIYARENIVRQKQALQIARDRFNGGTATKLDVYQAENVLGADGSHGPTAHRRSCSTALNALRVLLGMAPEPLGSLLGPLRQAKFPSRRRKSSVGIPGRSLAPPPGRSRRRTEGRGAKRADRRRAVRTLSGDQPYRPHRRLGQHHQRRAS